jgi:hypothetical protein
MLELYMARLLHLEALRGTSHLESIELKVLDLALNSIRDSLALSDLDVTVEDITKKVIQSSRRLYIGAEQSGATNDGLLAFVEDFLALSKAQADPSLLRGRQRTVLTSFELTSQTNLSLYFEGTANFSVHLTELTDKPCPDRLRRVGFTVLSQHPDGMPLELVACDTALTDTVYALFRYCQKIDEQGLRFDNGKWLGKRFNDFESNQLALEFIKNSGSYVVEHELAGLRDYLFHSEYPQFSFLDWVDSFEEAIEVFSRLTDYTTATYMSSLKGYELGESMAVNALATTLVLVKDEEQLLQLAAVCVEGMCDELALDEIVERSRVFGFEVHAQLEVFLDEDNQTFTEDHLLVQIEKVVKRFDEDDDEAELLT